MSAISVLGDFFARIGRHVYLAAELPVLSPGEPAFEPDIIAVRYESIPSRSGRLGSGVLELDLGIVEGRLRFFYGEAIVPESRELTAMLAERKGGS